MKKRTAIIGTLVSLLPMGQPLVIGTGTVVTSAAVMLTAPEIAKAESAVFYYNRAIDKYDAGDYSGAIVDYTKAIEINPKDADAYGNRGISKELIGDLEGACSDWRKASSLGHDEAAQWVRNQC